MSNAEENVTFTDTELVALRALSESLIAIRMLARKPSVNLLTPEQALSHIERIADAAHNLPAFLKKEIVNDEFMTSSLKNTFMAIKESED